MESSTLKELLTKTLSIPYKTLSYYDYAHKSVNLMWNLWKDTREFFIKVQNTSFFDSTKESIELNELQLQFLYFNHGYKPGCIKEDWKTWNGVKGKRRLKWYKVRSYFYINSPT